jgi:hypothetical protein
MMRRLRLAFMLLSLMTVYFVIAAVPASAKDGFTCYQTVATVQNNTSFVGSVTITAESFPPNVVHSATFTLHPGETRTMSVAGFLPTNAPHITYGISESPAMNTISHSFGIVPDLLCDGGFGQIDDGRINATDLGAPLAGYCGDDGSISIWDIDASGQGTLAFTVTKTAITRGLSKAASTGQNVLLGQGLGDSLYALSSNQLALVGPDVKEGGKTYQAVIAPDICD